MGTFKPQAHHIDFSNCWLTFGLYGWVVATTKAKTQKKPYNESDELEHGGGDAKDHDRRASSLVFSAARAWGFTPVRIHDCAHTSVLVIHADFLVTSGSSSTAHSCVPRHRRPHLPLSITQLDTVTMLSPSSTPSSLLPSAHHRPYSHYCLPGRPVQSFAAARPTPHHSTKQPPRHTNLVRFPSLIVDVFLCSKFLNLVYQARLPSRLSAKNISGCITPFER